jgi:hypothetical protein
MVRSDTRGQKRSGDGFEHGCRAVREARRAAVGMRRGPDSAFMARRAHGRGRVAAMRRRCADEWARHEERERLIGGTPR